MASEQCGRSRSHLCGSKKVEIENLHKYITGAYNHEPCMNENKR
jgi:hypothetical protein